MRKKDSFKTESPDGAGERGLTRVEDSRPNTRKAALKTAIQRRNLLKVLSVTTIPAAWARPVVEAVVLPAHAQTTSPPASVPESCGAPAGCYRYMNGPIDLYFNWPGGTGPETVNSFFGTECTEDDFSGSVGLVVAANAAEAEAMVGFPGADELITDPAPL